MTSSLIVQFCPSRGIKTVWKVLRRKPVPKVSPIKARLTVIGDVTFPWPVTRRVGCKSLLVNNDEPAVEEPKIELCVRDSEAAYDKCALP
jgi:hypothetical protein